MRPKVNESAAVSNDVPIARKSPKSGQFIKRRGLKSPISRRVGQVSRHVSNRLYE